MKSVPSHKSKYREPDDRFNVIGYDLRTGYLNVGHGLFLLFLLIVTVVVVFVVVAFIFVVNTS